MPGWQHVLRALRWRRACLPLLVPALVVVAAMTPDARATPAVHVVELRETGFWPPITRLAAGDTVRFVQQGSVPRWPASNLHPTHRIYPELDAGRPLGPGEHWEVRIERPGRWAYHDHLAPEVTGLLMVSHGAPSGLWDRLRRAWRTATDGIQRMRARAVIGAGRLYYGLVPGVLEADAARVSLKRLAVAADEDVEYWVAILGPERLLARLREADRFRGGFDCHQVAHRLGRAAYAWQGAVAFRQASSVCHSGYLHGAMEAFLAHGAGDDPGGDIERLCAGFPTRFARFQCYHGVGHGLLAAEGYDLPQAIEICGRLHTLTAQGGCLEGVFMENVVTALGLGASPVHRSPWLNRDPHFPCTLMGTFQLLFHCYQMQTTWMLVLHDQDVGRVARECQAAPPGLVGTCYRSLGRDIASMAAEPARITRLCATLPGATEELVGRCLGGALDVLVDFFGERLADQATTLCRAVPDAHKRGCYQALAGRLGELFTRRDDVQRVCDTFEAGYRALCAAP